MKEKEIEKLKQEIKKLKKELQFTKEKATEYLNGWKRAKADYINREREIEKEKEEWKKFANLNLILDLIPIFESFELAVKKISEKNKKIEDNIVQGINQIKKQFDKLLESAGVERIKTVGEKFNPELHEIVEKRGEGNEIVEEIQSGYKMYDKVIRPAKVVVK
ncbi:nucleotide exchange factor GrpE [bacterium]|nr:nucleotide exchange factor GrpE [bacterium]